LIVKNYTRRVGVHHPNIKYQIDKIDVKEKRYSKKVISQSLRQNCHISFSITFQNQCATLRAKGFCHTLCQNAFFLIHKLLSLFSICKRTLLQKLKIHRLFNIMLALRVTTGSGFGFFF